MTSLSGGPSLPHLHGKVIVGVRRVWYCLRDDVTSTVGPIELSFTDGSVVRLDVGPDGEALAIATSAWVDPFAPPLSTENELFVETSGKWSAFDVSGQAPYSKLVGAAIAEVKPHYTPNGKPVGATIHAGSAVVRANVDADELVVDVA